MRKVGTKKVVVEPTKEEIKKARAVMRVVRAKQIKKYRRRLPRYYDRDFHTWVHDMRTALASSARRIELTPMEIAERARDTANHMASLIAERNPSMANGKARSRRTKPTSLWYLWQEVFDGIIHELAARSVFTPEDLVERAKCVADAAMPHLKNRYRR